MRRCHLCRRRPHRSILLALGLSLLLCGLGLALNWQDLQLQLRRRIVDIDAILQLAWSPAEFLAGGANKTSAPHPPSLTTIQRLPRREGVTRWRPLNETAIKQLFSRMVRTAQVHSGHYRGRAAQMMQHRFPVIATQAWKLHSPAGRPYNLTDVQRLALESAGEGNSVPNFAHYVLPFGDTHLQFHHMVCLLSCLHVMRPARLLLWYAPGRLPTGEWWERVRRNLTEAEWERRVIMVRREAPGSVYTVPVFSREHKADIMRLEALLVFGGVYLDMDVLVLKPLEPLRRLECTIGREVSYGLCNGALVAAPNATFLAMWHTAYQVFNDGSWVDHSVWLPNSMNKEFPGLCHVEEESMHRPNWTPEEIPWIYGSGQQHRWKWREKNYLMHLWFRKYSTQHNMENIKTLNSMFGEMCRYILYGTK